MQDMTKGMKRRLAKLSGLAYERELEAELEKLVQEVENCRKQRKFFEAEEAIHRFHQGPARDLYKYYVMTPYYPMHVHQALEKGVLKQEEFSDDIMEFLGLLKKPV